MIKKISLVTIIGILFFTAILAIDSEKIISSKYRIYSYLSKNYIATEILNFKMFLQPGDEMITPYMLAFHHWEPLETTLIYNSLKEGDTFVDVGANLGYYTILAAKKIGNKGHVYAFEPEPNNFELLRMNIILNKLSNVSIFQKAVADKSGKMTLYLNHKNKGDHSLRKDIQEKDSILVDVISLDEFLNNKTIDLIKIDVQGADGLVLNGSKNIISKNKGLIIFTEFNPFSFRNLNSDPIKILTNLKTLGYKFSNLDEKNGKVTPMSINEILKNFDKPGIETNLMMLPN